MAGQIVGTVALTLAAYLKLGRYGKWGGLYWSDGKWNFSLDEKPNFNGDYDDELDLSFRTHDEEYWNAQAALKRGEISSVARETNPFAQQNAPIPLTAAALNLPDIKDAGAVRDLREAASLDDSIAADVQVVWVLSRMERMAA